jgi:hypothetical protein
MISEVVGRIFTDEPIVFLNNKDTSYYIDLLKIEVAKYYHANI